MENTILQKVQNLEYEALCELDVICKNNHIKFYMRGGSALGAVKYSGFVPWDDDIDIALFRDDYKKLIDVMPENIGEKFIFVCYQKTRNAHCYFPRIILNEKMCERLKLPQNNERGLLMIDILPIDGLPKSSMGRKLRIMKVYIYRLLASLWSIDVKKTVSMHESKKEKIIQLLHKTGIYKLYTQDGIYKSLDKLYEKHDVKNSQDCGILSSSKMQKEICPTQWWGKGVKKQFRNLDVLVPENFDGYLKKLFGENYVSYEPTESERTKSHIEGTI